MYIKRRRPGAGSTGCVRKVDPGLTGSLPAACSWVRQSRVSPLRVFPSFPLQALVLDKGEEQAVNELGNGRPGSGLFPALRNWPRSQLCWPWVAVVTRMQNPARSVDFFKPQLRLCVFRARNEAQASRLLPVGLGCLPQPAKHLPWVPGLPVRPQRRHPAPQN